MADNGWSQIRNRIWEDGPFLDLSTDAKTLFVFSFTHSPWASMTGLSVVSPRTIRRSMRRAPLLTHKALVAVLDELGDKPFVKYDWEWEVLWAVNRTRHVATASPKWIKGLTNHLERLPAESPLLTQYRRKYRAILKG